MARRMSLLAVLLIVGIAAAGYGAMHYMTSMPGKPHIGALPPLTPEEAALVQSLKRHIATIAAREHNLAHYDELEKVARYIEATLASLGYTVGRQEFLAAGKMVRNIEVTVEPGAQNSDPQVIVIGAHYDSVSGSPGANDNATGAAAVIELARLARDLDAVGTKRIRFAFFVNEEPPYFRTEAMGSLQYARALARRNERVIAMYSLETIGFYSSEPGSQIYPAPFGLMFPDRGDFVAFGGGNSAKHTARLLVIWMRREPQMLRIRNRVLNELASTRGSERLAAVPCENFLHQAAFVFALVQSREKCILDSEAKHVQQKNS